MYTCSVTKSRVTKQQQSQHRKCSAFLLCNREILVSNFGSGINFPKWEWGVSRGFPQYFGIAFQNISWLLPFHCIAHLCVLSFPIFLSLLELSYRESGGFMFVRNVGPHYASVYKQQIPFFGDKAAGVSNWPVTTL